MQDFIQPIYLVLVHAKVGARMLNKHVIFTEAARVNEKVNALPCRQFTLQQKQYQVLMPTLL